MTTLLEIKPYIHDFVEENLSTAFANKVYWIGERKNIPNYPYCMLSVIGENKDKRTSYHYRDIVDDDMKQKITTRYKTCTITVGIYNAWVEDTYSANDMDEENEFAYEQADLLEGLFEDYPINKMFSIQNISSIRSLPEVTSGGYIYRYEFDLTIGYNESVIYNKAIGKEIVIDMIDTNEPDTEIEDGSVYIDGEDAIANDLVGKDYFKTHFEITTDSNDNIEIETI